LKLASSGASKTRIVYRANLNFTVANSYFEFLTSKGYLEMDTSRKNRMTFYEVTETGKELLNTLRRAEKQLEGLFPGKQERINTQRRTINGRPHLGGDT
jgi:predicted transcriptional regulator